MRLINSSIEYYILFDKSKTQHWIMTQFLKEEFDKSLNRLQKQCGQQHLGSIFLRFMISNGKTHNFFIFLQAVAFCTVLNSSGSFLTICQSGHFIVDHLPVGSFHSMVFHCQVISQSGQFTIGSLHRRTMIQCSLQQQSFHITHWWFV